MFCTSIRRRPSFGAVVPILQADDGLKLREHKLITHDLSIPLQPDANASTTTLPDPPARRLRVMLLSPSCMRHLEATTKRIEHFALLTGHQDLTIIFLINTSQSATVVTSAPEPSITTNGISPADPNHNGTRAWSNLRAHLHTTSPAVLAIPMLPLASLDDLPILLKKRVSQLTHPPIISRVPTARPIQLLRLCTASGTPLSQDTTNILSDVFPNLRSLARACIAARQDEMEGSSQITTIERLEEDEDKARLRQLRDLVGEEEYRDIADFWRDEYIVQ